jgi:hypothetical protein
MNEDYLWDKSGQPDPQIQELEEILGTLRYQPKPLAIPRDLVASRRRNYFPLLAIAATVLLAVLAAGVWIQVRTSSESQPRQAKLPETPVVKEDVKPEPGSVPVNKPAVRENGLAATNKRPNRSSASRLKRREREEALAAKEQLMLALRVASEKLNLAHRKTQSTPPANQIKNQHRIG